MSKSCLLILAVIFAALPVPSDAESRQNFCKAAPDAMRQDASLATAAKAVFPAASDTNRDEDCLYPLETLHYGDADVLLTTGNTPGEACHGCAASLSAYVLERTPTGPRVVARFLNFDATGTNGNPGDIASLQIAGHDAFSVESGGIFQGFSATKVDFYLFRDRRLDHLQPALSLSANNEGAMTDEKQTITVDGAWHVEPGAGIEVTIDYKITAKGRSRMEHATWTVRDNKLELIRGQVPPEFDAASGN